MYNEKDIKNEIDSLSTLGEVVRVFAEISSIRMKRTRDVVLASRAFLQSLNDIFYEVVYYYRKKVLQAIRKKSVSGREMITFLAHNGKSVAVYLSANTGLYGDIMQKTFDFFLDNVRKKNYEITIIGKLGLSLFLEEEPGRPYTYFDLPDQKMSEAELSAIIGHLVQYEEICVFYPKFKNILEQGPAMFNISANTPIPDIYGVLKKEAKRMYIFEPSIEKILVFFETEVFGSTFEQSVAESQLAKYASRMMAMDRASENIKESLGKLKVTKLRLSHMVANKKQLDSFSTKLAYSES